MIARPCCLCNGNLLTVFDNSVMYICTDTHADLGWDNLVTCNLSYIILLLLK